ncbi:hypothetical protein BN938_0045 [Mucinivorans hirudinis]|uniref:Uncharacterized protein n=1 Tax=Mucinivorans hirudinis TaxID=1433126 RepID=A0A060R5S5_9BACT|nr:hypothetical protein BN938_0045 [Mucinivorans hirudinis]
MNTYFTENFEISSKLFISKFLYGIIMAFSMGLYYKYSAQEHIKKINNNREKNEN